MSSDNNNNNNSNNNGNNNNINKTNIKNQFLQDMNMIPPPNNSITIPTSSTNTTNTTNTIDKLQQSPSPSEHKISNYLNSLNQNNASRLRTLNRASSLQNLSSQPNGVEGSITIPPHRLALSTKPKEDEEKIEEKFNLIKYDATNSNHPTPSSKYDFVKVKVHLQENHYYVLSRFLISRVLNVTKVDAADSVKISLALKKTLVDQGRLTITQPELENELFKLLQSYGYGKEYIERYKMTTQFHHQRVPLIILISGPKFIGKSWLATQLAERLNLSTVLQTTLVHDLMYTIIKEYQPKVTETVAEDHPSNLYGMPSDPPIVFKNHKSKEELITEFKKECIMIRHGVDTDIEKCFEEGKAIIIEGPHIDPYLFTELIQERNMISPIQFVFEKTKSNEDLIKLEMEQKQPQQPSTSTQSPQKPRSLSNNSNNNINNNTTSTSQPVEIITPDEIPTNIPPTIEQPQLILSAEEIEKQKKLATAALINSLRKPKSKGIIIPFVLSINPEDHRFLIENWLSTSPYDQENASKAFGTEASQQTECLLNNLQSIQEYLISGCPPFQKVEVNAHCLLETLDVLHSAVLKRINTAYSGHVKGFDYES